jgi:hypothetical protein
MRKKEFDYGVEHLRIGALIVGMCWVAGFATAATYTWTGSPGATCVDGSATLALDDSGISGDAVRLTLIDNQTAGAVTGTFAGLAEGAVFR